ncbi:Flagellar hook-associated protein 1 [Zhongshania aliphaticivorans]|uniref:Flagellar hook-associated protein 1 n=1 Tax=Zhongshania aliphaticivorans TaxID=1470434 RepID=A0A5S9NLY1_9GAMM|nr:flagellar hook-associated protein FlgK [Zhongshania aliphaticivorans]CAA0091009.1 Flagellar hook-associated protein 1 [Zhongshania aliphaticivorans]CAA0098502.1 Flagellar hook-associated protein 1 [Zhongshania aliphaticivorans]
MGDMLGNALSGLVSYQRALATTSHNIANADTEGYSRQTVDFSTRVPQQSGDLTIGSGVKVSSISRVYNSFTVDQLRNAQASSAQADSYYQLTGQIDNSLADTELGLSASLSRFYDSLQDVADSPSSISARQLMLAEAQALGERFSDMSSQLDTLNSEVNTRISASVSDINDLSAQIADINSMISKTQGQFSTGANDLLDQRDQALLSLNELIGTTSVEQSDGTVSVFVGSGQALVLGERAMSMKTVSNEFEPGRVEIAMDLGGSDAVISDSLSGGSLGGTLSFRDGVLNDTRNELGRITVAIADTLNELNRSGMDLNGEQGGDIFSIPAPEVYRSKNNTSGAEFTAQITDVSSLTGDNTVIRLDSAGWRFFDEASGAELTNVTGSGSTADPFVIDGVSVSLSSPAAQGDQFLLRSTQEAAGSLTVVMTDPAGIAAAAATRSSADLNNIGSAEISETDVVDSSNPNVLDSVDIQFLSANSYQVNGTGTYSYTSGSQITINGNAVTITGVPEAGDSFSIGANTNASGDNRNLLKMAEAESEKVLNGGSASIQDTVNGLVGDVAVATRSAQINQQSQQNLLAQTQADQQSVSGVNLDEEAANLLRFQQAYQAAAQAASIANSMFQSLIGAFN